MSEARNAGPRIGSHFCTTTNEGSLQLSSFGSVLGDIDAEQGDATIEAAGSVLGSVSAAGRLSITVGRFLEADGVFADVISGIHVAGGYVNSIVAGSAVEGDIVGLDRIELTAVTNGGIVSAPDRPTVSIEIRAGIGLVHVISTKPQFRPARIEASLVLDSDGDQSQNS